jgi:hypothetical protein
MLIRLQVRPREVKAAIEAQSASDLLGAFLSMLGALEAECCRRLPTLGALTWRDVRLVLECVDVTPARLAAAGVEHVSSEVDGEELAGRCELALGVVVRFRMEKVMDRHGCRLLLHSNAGRVTVAAEQHLDVAAQIFLWGCYVGALDPQLAAGVPGSAIPVRPEAMDWPLLCYTENCRVVAAVGLNDRNINCRLQRLLKDAGLQKRGVRSWRRLGINAVLEGPLAELQMEKVNAMTTVVARLHGWCPQDLTSGTVSDVYVSQMTDNMSSHLLMPATGRGAPHALQGTVRRAAAESMVMEADNAAAARRAAATSAQRPATSMPVHVHLTLMGGSSPEFAAASIAVNSAARRLVDRAVSDPQVVLNKRYINENSAVARWLQNLTGKFDVDAPCVGRLGLREQEWEVRPWVDDVDVRAYMEANKRHRCLAVAAMRAQAAAATQVGQMLPGADGSEHGGGVAGAASGRGVGGASNGGDDEFDGFGAAAAAAAGSAVAAWPPHRDEAAEVLPPLAGKKRVADVADGMGSAVSIGRCDAALLGSNKRVVVIAEAAVSPGGAAAADAAAVAWALPEVEWAPPPPPPPQPSPPPPKPPGPWGGANDAAATMALPLGGGFASGGAGHATGRKFLVVVNGLPGCHTELVASAAADMLTEGFLYLTSVGGEGGDGSGGSANVPGTVCPVISGFQVRRGRVGVEDDAVSISMITDIRSALVRANVVVCCDFFPDDGLQRVLRCASQAGALTILRDVPVRPSLHDMVTDNTEVPLMAPAVLDSLRQRHAPVVTDDGAFLVIPSGAPHAPSLDETDAVQHIEVLLDGAQARVALACQALPVMQRVAVAPFMVPSTPARTAAAGGSTAAATGRSANAGPVPVAPSAPRVTAAGTVPGSGLPLFGSAAAAGILSLAAPPAPAADAALGDAASKRQREADGAGPSGKTAKHTASVAALTLCNGVCNQQFPDRLLFPTPGGPNYPPGPLTCLACIAATSTSISCVPTYSGRQGANKAKEARARHGGLTTNSGTAVNAMAAYRVKAAAAAAAVAGAVDNMRNGAETAASPAAVVTGGARTAGTSGGSSGDGMAVSNAEDAGEAGPDAAFAGGDGGEDATPAEDGSLGSGTDLALPVTAVALGPGQLQLRAGTFMLQKESQPADPTDPAYDAYLSPCFPEESRVRCRIIYH